MTVKELKDKLAEIDQPDDAFVFVFDADKNPLGVETVRAGGAGPSVFIIAEPLGRA